MKTKPTPCMLGVATVLLCVPPLGYMADWVQHQQGLNPLRVTIVVCGYLAAVVNAFRWGQAVESAKNEREKTSL